MSDRQDARRSFGVPRRAVRKCLSLVRATIVILAIIEIGCAAPWTGLGNRGEIACDACAGGYTRRVFVAGNRAYLATTCGLQIIDVSQPRNPTLMKTVRTRGDCHDVCVVGSLAYLANADEGLLVLDVSDPGAPRALGNLRFGGSALNVAVSGAIAYVSVFGRGIHIVDVSVPANPQLRGTLDAKEEPVGYGGRAWLYGNYLYVSSFSKHSNSTHIVIYDASDPLQITKTDSLDLGRPMKTIFVRGSYGYAVSDWGIKVFQISAAGDARLLETVYLRVQHFTLTGGYLSDRFLYLAGREGGTAVVDLSDPSKPTLLTTIPVQAVDVFVRGDLAFVAESSYGLRIVDVSGPASPRILSGIGVTGSPDEMVVVKGYAFIVFGSHLAVVDLSNPERLKEVASLETPGARGKPCTDGRRLYVPAQDRGVYVVDIRDPRKPRLARTLTTSGRVRAVATDGAHLYITFELFDAVEFPEQPGVLANGRLVIVDVSAADFGALTGEVLLSEPGYQMSVDRKRLYVYGEAAAEAWDVSNPSLPRRLGDLTVPGRIADMAIRGDHAYVAANQFGLHVLDLSRPGVPQIIPEASVPGAVHKVAVRDDRLIVLGSKGLEEYEIRASRTPRFLRALPAPGASRMIIQPPYVYLLSTCGLSVLR